MTPDNFTPGRAVAPAQIAACPSRAYDTVGWDGMEIRLRCYYTRSRRRGVDAFRRCPPDQPLLVLVRSCPRCLFLCGLRGWPVGGMQTVQRTRGAPDGAEAISSGARSMYLPFPPRPKSSSLGSPARRDTRQPLLSRRDLTPATHDSSCSRGGGHQSRWQEPRGRAIKSKSQNTPTKRTLPMGAQVGQ